ncbi:MAG: ABC transporter permease [Acidimicrobiia bacterium]
MTARRIATGSSLIRNSRVLVGRSVRHIVRSTDALVLSVALPVTVLLLFVYVFGGAIRTDTRYVNYVAPGIILLTAGFGAGLTATAVCADLTEGFMDRLRSMPVRPSSAVAGHVVASMVRNLIVTALVFAVAIAIGFRPLASPWQWLGVVAILSLYVLAITWFAVILGLVAKNVDAAGGFAFFVAFVPYVSSAFVPTDTMPVVLRTVADHQPVTPIIETARGLLLDQPLGNNAWFAIAWCAGILAVAIPVSAHLFHKRTAA